jgi:replicative DNA helicase
METQGKTHSSERYMAYSSGNGFGNKTKDKKSLVEIPKLRDLAQLVAPEAIEDEWGVMSCILTSQKPEDVFLKVANILEPRHFGLPMLQDIWRIMLDMHRQHTPIAYSVLQCHLQDAYEKNQEFFDEFVPKMYECTHEEEYVTIYADRILSKYHKRTLIGACSEGISATLQHMEPGDALVELERRISEVRQEIHSNKKKGGSCFDDLLDEYIDELKAEASGEKSSGTIKTGNWYDFNTAAQGFAPGDFIVIGAPTSCGKSMAGIGLAREFALEGHAVAYVSLEIPKKALIERLMSPVLGFSATATRRSGMFSNEKVQAVEEFREKYSGKLKIAVQKPSQNSYESFQKSMAEAESRYREKLGDDFTGFRVVIVDYIQLLASNVPAQFRVIEIDRVAQLLRNYALENNCTVIALAQQDTETAKAAGKEPDSLNCLSYCKTIDNHATQIIFMHNPKFGDRKTIHDATYIDFIWMKNREGSNGRVRMGVNWLTGELFSLASTGKSNFEPTQAPKSDPWEKLAEKYGTTSKTKKSKEIAEAPTEEIVIDLPELNLSDPLLSIATPMGADAELVQQVQSFDTDFDEDEEEIAETLTEEALVDPESATVTVDVQPVEETTGVAKEAVASTGDTIEINGEVYEIGEEAWFSSGASSKPVVGLVKILGTAEYGCISIQHLDTIRWDASTQEYSGKEFRWKEGKLDEVHPGRISKKPRST